MAKMRLKGEAARKWLAENPNVSYKDINTGQLVDRTSGIGKLLMGVSKPFRQGAGVAEEFGYTIGDIINGLGGKDQIERPKNYALMTEEESKQLYEKPLQTGLKAGAGVASYGIPVGAAKGVTGLRAIGQAAGKGALAGGLGGFGYSEEGKELESILKGGALGGVIAGTLQGVGEGARMLGKKGQIKTYQTDRIEDIEALPKSLKASLKKQAKGSGLWDKSGKVSDAENIRIYLQDRGVAGSYPEATLNNIAKRFENGQRLKSTALEQMDQVPDDIFAKAYADLSDKASKSGLELQGTKPWKIVEGKLLSPKTSKALDIDRIIMEWNDNGRNVRGVLKPNEAKVYAYAAESLRDTIRNSNIPGAQTYSGALDDMFASLKLQDQGAISKAVKNQAEAGVRLPFTKQVTAPLEKVSQGISKAQSKLGRLQESMALPREALEQIPKGFGIGQRAIPGIVGMGAQAPEREEISQEQGLGTQLQEQYSFPDAIAEAYAYFPNASEAQIISVAKYLMDQKGGSEKDTGTIANVQQAIQMIDQYGSSAAGKIPFVTGKVSEFFGGASEGTTYRSLISDIRTKIIKQIAGTAQTPTEMKNLVDRLPEPTDEPAVAKAKLQVLLNSLQGGSGIQPSEQQLSDQYIDY